MASPYADTLEKILDPSRFFQYDEKTAKHIFIGDDLEIRIPQRYEVYGLLDIADYIDTLGVLDLIINGRYHCALNILNAIRIYPSDMGHFTYEGIPYLTLYLKSGDIFINNVNVVKDPNAIYAVFKEFIERGNFPYFYDYHSMLLEFDRVEQQTGSDLGIDMSLYSVLIAHLSRNANNLFEQYRFTDMKEPPKFIGLRSVTYAPTGTTARINGSYADDGVVAALLNQTEEKMPFEDLLRGIPSEG